MNLKPFEKKLKRLVNYFHPWRWLTFMSIRQSHRLEKGAFSQDKIVILRFSSEYWHDDMGRYAYLIAKAFAAAGYQLVFYADFHFLSRLKKYKKLLFKESFKVSDKPYLHKDSIFFFNENIRVCVKNAITISPTKFTPNRLAIPYMMHPKIYDSGIDQQLNELSTSIRNGKILFAGNINQKLYRGGKVQSFYKKTPRYELIQFLQENLHTDELAKVLTTKDLYHESYQNLLTLINTEQLKIPFEEWLATLSRYDFFLACPGSDMPMCHNAIEAMAVGSIPILEYAEYFHPALIHHENCILFRGKNDLLIKLREVLEMESEEVQKLRKKVIAYYEAHLEPKKWVKQLANTQENQCEVVFDAWKIPEYTK